MPANAGDFGEATGEWRDFDLSRSGGARTTQIEKFLFFADRKYMISCNFRFLATARGFPPPGHRPLKLQLPRRIGRSTTTETTTTTSTMVQKLVSGGQTGVDRAALYFALERSISSGGWCPRGRESEDGRIPDRFPLREVTGGYRPRNEKYDILRPA